MICPKCNYAMSAFDTICPRCKGQGTQLLPSTPNYSIPLAPATFTVWHYAQAGKRNGPVSEDSIGSLIAQGTLNRDSLVWQDGMNDWLPVAQTTLARFLPASQKMPAVIGDGVSNTIVWILAFAPFIGVFFQAFLGAATNAPAVDFWWVTIAVNIILCVLDERKLKDAGHDPKVFAGASLLVPIYLFFRASKLKQNSAYAWVWLVCFFLSLSTPAYNRVPVSGVSSPASLTTQSAAPADLDVQNVSTESDMFSGKITGTVINTGDRNFGYAQISFNLYDDAGNQVGSAFDNIANLEPHGRWKFSAVVFNKAATHFKLKGLSAY